MHLVRTWCAKQMTPYQHVDVLRNWTNLTWAWPHDGRNATLAGAGKPLAQQYRDAGLDMMTEPATHEEGGNSLEAGLQKMADMMRGGKWKVHRGNGNEQWLQEYRLYHRGEDGRVVAENDDCISASRYALMMRRYGRVGYSRGIFSQRWKAPEQRFV
jgi:hypothetical protein